MISSFFYLFSISHSISISATQILFGILFIASLVIYYKTKEPLNFDKKLLTLFLIFFGFISLSVIINYSNFPTIKKVISKTFSWWHYLVSPEKGIFSLNLKNFLFIKCKLCIYFGILFFQKHFR
jgi:hypothetical protein